jgi:hypothetical protein
MRKPEFAKVPSLPSGQSPSHLLLGMGWDGMGLVGRIAHYYYCPLVRIVEATRTRRALTGRSAAETRPETWLNEVWV